MPDVPASDWQPNQYLKFQKERTQPAIDLVSHIEAENPGRIIDIGCGTGTSTAILKKRWPFASVVGLDNSEAMLEKAKSEFVGIEWVKQDVSADLSHLGSFDIVFSNAALQWMPNHTDLIPRLFSMVCPGGILAVQAPNILNEPFYVLLREIVRSPRWKKTFEAISPLPDYHSVRHFYDILCPLGCETTLWQTSYIYPMQSHMGIVEWYKGSGLRPYLDKLPEEETKRAFIGEYVEALQSAYTPQSDGRLLFVMPRVFFMASKR